MNKAKVSQFTAETTKQNYRGIMDRFVASNKTFFVSLVKEHQHSGKGFLCDVFAIAKPLGTPTYFLALSCADLR